LTAIRIKDGENFEIGGKTHQILYCPREAGKPIEFYKSTQLDGFDIYIWESLINKYPFFWKLRLLADRVLSKLDKDF